MLCRELPNPLWQKILWNYSAKMAFGGTRASQDKEKKMPEESLDINTPANICKHTHLCNVITHMNTIIKFSSLLPISYSHTTPRAALSSHRACAQSARSRLARAQPGKALGQPHAQGSAPFSSGLASAAPCEEPGRCRDIAPSVPFRCESGGERNPGAAVAVRSRFGPAWCVRRQHARPRPCARPSPAALTACAPAQSGGAARSPRGLRAELFRPSLGRRELNTLCLYMGPWARSAYGRFSKVMKDWHRVLVRGLGFTRGFLRSANWDLTKYPEFVPSIKTASGSQSNDVWSLIFL